MLTFRIFRMNGQNMIVLVQHIHIEADSIRHAVQVVPIHIEVVLAEYAFAHSCID